MKTSKFHGRGTVDLWSVSMELHNRTVVEKHLEFQPRSKKVIDRSL